MWSLLDAKLQIEKRGKKRDKESDWCDRKPLYLLLSLSLSLSVSSFFLFIPNTAFNPVSLPRYHRSSGDRRGGSRPRRSHAKTIDVPSSPPRNF